MHQLIFEPGFKGWQQAARQALANHWQPENVSWEERDTTQPGLAFFEENKRPETSPTQEFRVPKTFIDMAGRVACYRDSRRWALLYRTLWRLTHGEPKLMEIVVDPDVHELIQMDKGVRRDIHKMRAFVRFRTVTENDQTWYVAWFEPQHFIVERNASFFVNRFASMRWSILTPERCAHWDGEQLTFTAGVSKSEAPDEDKMEQLWRTYYGNIFNPARVKTKAMQSEMPKRYWKNLPEADIIPDLLKRAPLRVQQMIEKSTAEKSE